MAIPFLISTVFSPVIGMFIDSYGQRLNILLVSIILMFGSYIQLLYIYPFLPMALIGISLTIFSTVVWASSCFLVSQNSLGMALGIMTAMQNAGVMVAPLVITMVKNHFQHNNYIIYQLIVLTGLAFILFFRLSYLDSY